MTFNITVKGEELNIKFDYRLMLKANRFLSSVNEDTKQPNNDGAPQLFLRLQDEDDQAIRDIINLHIGGNKEISDEEFTEAVELYVAERGYEEMFQDALDELKSSGFFMKKIKNYLKQIEKNKDFLEEEKEIKALEVLIGEIKQGLS